MPPSHLTGQDQLPQAVCSCHLLSFCSLSSPLHQAETEATSTSRKSHPRRCFLLAQQFDIHLKHWKLTETRKLETTYIKICTNKKTSKYIKHCDGQTEKCRTFCPPFMLFLAIESLFKPNFFPYFQPSPEFHYNCKVKRKQVTTPLSGETVALWKILFGVSNCKCKFFWSVGFILVPKCFLSFTKLLCRDTPPGMLQSRKKHTTLSTE